MSMVFHFVRHAPVIGQDGIAYGRDAEIDQSCHSLFKAAAQQLPHDCDIWIASGFPRTQATARMLQEELGTFRPIAIHETFNEQDFGTLAGRSKAEIIADPANADYLADMVNIAPPGGEAVPEMVARVSNALHDLAADMHAFGKNEAVIVCHGGVIRSARQLHSGGDFDLHQKVPHLSVHSYRFDL